MKFQIISIALGRDKDKILNKYKNLKSLESKLKIEGSELFVIVDTLKELMDLIQKVINQNCFICNDENTIHIYDQKFK